MRYLLIIVSLTLLSLMASCGGGGSASMSPDLTAAAAVNGTDSSSAPRTVVTPLDPMKLDSSSLSASSINNLSGTTTVSPRRASALAPPAFKKRETSIKYGLAYLDSVDGTFLVDGAGPYTNTWEWYRTAGSANANIQGEVIQYALEAASTLGGHDEDHNAQFALDAIDNYLVPAYSAGGPFAALRPYACDVGALISAYKLTHNAAYMTLAVDLANRTTDDDSDGNSADGYSGAEFADRMIANRASLAGWDIATYISNWYELGRMVHGSQGSALKQWATDCLTQMWDRRADWEDVPAWGYNYTALSDGGLLAAYSVVDKHGFKAARNYFADQVLARQNAGGWWVVSDSAGNEWDDVQATAACVTGLNAADTHHSEKACKKGEAYLRSADIQLNVAPNVGAFGGYLGDPGWPSAGVYVVSLTAEAIKALASFEFDHED